MEIDKSKQSGGDHVEIQFQKLQEEERKEKTIELRKKIIQLKSIGRIYCCAGISSAYEQEIPKQVVGRIDKQQYEEAIMNLNEQLLSYWPCDLSIYIGIGCTCLTFGFSLLLPFCCLGEAQTHALSYIAYLNRTVFEKRLMQLSLKSFLYKSWLELKVYYKPDEIEV